MAEPIGSKKDASIESSIPVGGASLESILCTEELLRRASRPPDYEKENRALVALVSALADSPRTILQTLAETILDITQCDSAGLSLLTTNDGGKRFYWPAIAGVWKPHVGGGTPRNFGPCGDVLDCNRTLLFKHFERRYPYLVPVMPPAEECLLVPFYIGGKAVGTIWAIMHSDRRKFDAEDDRIMASLGKFASSAYQAVASIDDLKFQVAEREKIETELRELTDGLERQVRSRTEELEMRNTQLMEAQARLAEEKLALERSERYLAEAQRLAHIGSWAGNIVSRQIFHSSEEHTRLHGLDPDRGAPSFEDLYHRVHPDDQVQLVEAFERASREGTDVGVHYRIVFPDDTTRDVEAVGHPVFKPSGEPGEFVGFLMDVTERKRAEEQHERLRQVQADLAHINRVSTMGELTASLAHEIKQPIYAALINAETCLQWLTRERPEVTGAQEAVSRLIKDLARASEIIGRIGSLFKKNVLQRELVNINDLIQEMIILLRSEAARNSISIHGTLADDLPQVMVDRVQLQQVLMNLMLNGIEAMKDMGTARELTIISKQDENHQLLVSVADTGVGIKAEQQEQIFKAFFSSKPQGTGMGLPISRSIVEAHGGRLWANLNRGPGATFQFTLPIQAATHNTQKSGFLAGA